VADRRVRQTGKDGNGDITALCNPGKLWSPRSRIQAVNDIRTGRHSYFVDEAGYRTDVHVTPDGHLRADPDPASANNLDNLPDCSTRRGPSAAWLGMVDSRKYG
jgi:hypothetical protein